MGWSKPFNGFIKIFIWQSEKIEGNFYNMPKLLETLTQEEIIFRWVVFILIRENKILGI